jgi:thioredoxin-related protein
MKIIISTILLLLVTIVPIHAEGIKFFKGSFEEAKALAAKEHKIIFMDAYTSWCGPCKRMAREVFTQDAVGAFFNKHFINLKVDMEKGEGPAIAQQYRVTSYPTFLFLDEKGATVHLAKGGRPADQFIGQGKAALVKNDKSGEYAEKYEEGERSPEFLLAYARALQKSAKPSLKIANEYLRTQKDLSTDENIDFLYEFTMEADSKIFEYFVANKNKIIARKSEQEYKSKVIEACDATIVKAIGYKVPALVEEAKKQMKAANPSFSKQYNMLADINYSKGKEEVANAVKLLSKYLKKYAKTDAVQWDIQAQYVLRSTEDKKLLHEAAGWAEQATKLDYQAKYLKTHAGILRKLGLGGQAAKLAEAAQNLGGK